MNLKNLNFIPTLIIASMLSLVLSSCGSSNKTSTTTPTTTTTTTTTPTTTMSRVIGASSESACRGAGQADQPVCFIVNEDGNSVDMFGVIGSDALNKVTTLDMNFPNAKDIVLHNVPGSQDDAVNLQAAKFIYDKSFNTSALANSVIASGGVDFFLAGNTREYATGAMFGVHSWAGGGGIEGAESLPLDGTNSAHKLYLDYYESIGIDLALATEFYFFTLAAAPSSSIHVMTDAQLTQFMFARTR